MNPLEKAKNLRVMAIGETIIDEYIFVKATGRASKDPILSTKYKGSESYLGGILAPARHLANFVDKIHVVSILGDELRKEEEIQEKIPKNITAKFFTKKNSPTILKQRFVEPHHYRKLFKTEFMNDEPIEEGLTKEIIRYIEEKKDNYDIILVNDFGHGFINGKLSQYLAQTNKYLAINVQSNSANYGFNLPTKFPRADYLTLNTSELLLLYRTKEEHYENLLEKMNYETNFSKILLTTGKEGVIYQDSREKKKASAIITNPVDTVGAGDAVFSITTLLAYQNESPATIVKYANAIGAVAVNIVGNKESITKEMIEKYL